MAHAVGPQTTWAEPTGLRRTQSQAWTPRGPGLQGRRAAGAAAVPFSGPTSPGKFNYRAAEKNPPCSEEILFFAKKSHYISTIGPRWLLFQAPRGAGTGSRNAPNPPAGLVLAGNPVRMEAQVGGSSLPLDLCLENEQNIAAACPRAVNKGHGQASPRRASLLGCR